MIMQMKQFKKSADIMMKVVVWLMAIAILIRRILKTCLWGSISFPIHKIQGNLWAVCLIPLSRMKIILVNIVKVHKKKLKDNLYSNNNYNIFKKNFDILSNKSIIIIK